MNNNISFGPVIDANVNPGINYMPLIIKLMLMENSEPKQTPLQQRANRAILKAMLLDKAKHHDKKDLQNVLEARSEAVKTKTNQEGKG